LLISGSLRAGSVNVAVLKTAQDIAPVNVVAWLYPSMAELPHFNPDGDRAPLPPAVAELREAIGRADAILFCTPEYAGGLPGSFKNLLDWTVGGVEMDGKPVAWINAASPAAPAGGEDAYAALRKVLGYVGARIVEAACIHLPVSRQDANVGGIIGRDDIRSRISASLLTLVGSARP
jgi:NAD(P)H-dependent FMN reductase